LLNDGQRNYGYDTANRLTSVTEGAVTTQFEYNGDGDRYAQTVNGVTTDYVLDLVGLAQVLVETIGGQTAFYVPGLAQYSGDNWQYFASDRLGSTRQLVDAAGGLVQSQTFDPFGNVLVQGGVGSSGFGYTGEEVDSTGLVYLRARYYNPATGRFQSKDPWPGNPLRSQSQNGFSYVEGNPVSYTDPSGYYIFEQAENPTGRTFHPSPFVSSDTYFLSPADAFRIYGIPTPMRVSMASVIDPTGEGLLYIAGMSSAMGFAAASPLLLNCGCSQIRGPLPGTSAYRDVMGDPGPTGLNWNRTRYAHNIGTGRGQAAASEDGFTPSGWQNPFANRGNYGQGFDDIYYGPLGDPVIVEYKGGANPRLSGRQMGREWMEANIQRLIRVDDPMGLRLRAAFDNGTLTGVAYLTPIQCTIPQPTQRIYFTYP
jgi:RHS repeat-associated protein